MQRRESGRGGDLEEGYGQAWTRCCQAAHAERVCVYEGERKNKMRERATEGERGRVRERVPSVMHSNVTWL